MICTAHDWYLGLPCPKCAEIEAAKNVTAAATPPPRHPAEIPAPKSDFAPKWSVLPPPKRAGQAPPTAVTEPPAPKIDFAATWDQIGRAPEDEIAAMKAAAAEDEDVPAFLKRNRDGSVVDPRTWGPFKALENRTAVPLSMGGETNIRRWSDAHLEQALQSTEFSIAAKQPMFKEIHRRRGLKVRVDKRANTKEKGDTQPED